MKNGTKRAFFHLEQPDRDRKARRIPAGFTCQAEQRLSPLLRNENGKPK
jgi:hypothetical protein